MTVISQLVENVTGKLLGGGVTLSLKPDSLLAPIAGEVQLIAENVEGPSLESMANQVNDYFDASNPNPFEVSTESFNLGNTFEQGVAALADDITPMAVAIVSKIKDNIIPATNIIFDAAYTHASEKVDGGGVRLNIVTNGLEHPLFSNVALTSILDSYAESGSFDHDRTMGINFPELTTEALRTALSSVNASLNTDVSDLLGAESEELIQAAYKSVFNVPGGTPINGRKLFGRELRLRVIGLLLALAFTEECPEGVTGVDDIDQYRNILRKTVGCYALHLRNVLEYCSKFEKNDQLVIQYPQKGSEFTVGAEIIVCGIQFERWLELGGTVDSIYGAYVTDQSINGDHLLAERDNYERNWLRYIQTKQSSMRDDFESVFISALRDALYAYAKENNMTIRESGVDFLFTRGHSIDADNAYAFTRRVVCSTLFEDGEYLSILESIDAISNASPELTLEEAVDIALPEWLADWALDQISVGKL